jgi:hypothetical protein
VFVLRGLHHPGRWDKDAPELSLLPLNEVPADPVWDLKTTGNKLSLYLIDGSMENILRVGAALKSGRKEPEQFDYKLISLDAFDTLGIELIVSEGETPDDEVNSWHRDAILSANKLVTLTQAFWQNGTQGSFLEHIIADRIRDGVNMNQLDRGRMHQKLLTALGISLR